ncbi:transglutaminase domain-containing protein [bacterium]|nr:transglutaminase domain-containing protein [bacterium]
MKKDLKNLILILLLGSTIFFPGNDPAAAGEIRSGSEKAVITIEGNFDLLPETLEYYNYKAVFSRIDHSKLAVNVISSYKPIKDSNDWKSLITKETKRFARNSVSYSKIDDYFSRNIFSDKDTYLERVFKIFDWLNTNVKYKIVPGNEGEDPEFVFTRRSGDCYGYTVLTVYLLRLSGIPAQSVFSYLFDKGETEGISSDYFHSLVSVLHPEHGWILWEPQKIFLNVTTDHISIYNEQTQPKSVVHYFDKGGDGGMEFVTGEDETNYRKNQFLDIFLKSGKDGKEKKETLGYKVTGIAADTDYKYITSENPIQAKSVLSSVTLPNSMEYSEYIMLNKDTNELFKLEYEKDKDLIRYSAKDSSVIYIYDDGRQKRIFGLGDGTYFMFYQRSSLPVAVYKLSVSGKEGGFARLNVNYLLEKGNFKSVDIVLEELGEMSFDNYRRGFLTVDGIQFSPEVPLFLDYNSEYFYIFGLSKRKIAFRFKDSADQEKMIHIQ